MRYSPETARVGFLVAWYCWGACNCTFCLVVCYPATPPQTPGQRRHLIVGKRYTRNFYGRLFGNQAGGRSGPRNPPIYLVPRTGRSSRHDPRAKWQVRFFATKGTNTNSSRGTRAHACFRELLSTRLFNWPFSCSLLRVVFLAFNPNSRTLTAAMATSTPHSQPITCPIETQPRPEKC